MAHTTGARADDVLTLEQAVSLAIENNRGLKSSAIEIQKAQDRLAATRTRQFPSINLYMLGSQQLRSFDFTLEKGTRKLPGNSTPLPSEDVHLKTSTVPTGLVMGKIAQPISTLVRIRRSMDSARRDKQIPIVARLRPDEFAQLGEVGNLYAYSNSGKQKVPVSQVARLGYSFSGKWSEGAIKSEPSRSPQFHAKALSSEVMNVIRRQIISIAGSLPPGYKLDIGGEEPCADVPV